MFFTFVLKVALFISRVPYETKNDFLLLQCNELPDWMSPSFSPNSRQRWTTNVSQDIPGLCRTDINAILC